MAYSDYGGYAFRNGQRVEARSDAVLTPEGIQSTPGSWPGWVLEAGRTGGSWHVLLGDGPIFVALYKQSTVAVFRLHEKIDAVSLIVDPEPGSVEEYGGGRFVNVDFYRDNHKPCVFEVDGHRLEVHWTHEDNYYVYARLVQPDTTVWMGWSGYGVGAGLEDCGYGYSTEDRNSVLLRLVAGS